MDYITFVEAMRKRRVLQGTGRVDAKLLEDFYRKQDWAIPSYDFGTALAMEGSLGRPPDRFLHKWGEWWLKGRFRLPHPECVFLHEGEHSHMLIRAMEQDDESVILQTFGRAKAGGSAIVRTPFTIKFMRHEDSGDTYGVRIKLAIEEGATFQEEDLYPWAKLMIGRVSMPSFALTAKPDDDFLTTSDLETPSLQSANKGRVGAGLEPLPATKVVRIRFDALDRATWSREGSRSPKSPHMRRGHPRQYKDGKVVWIEATAVKGGGVPVLKKVVIEM